MNILKGTANADVLSGLMEESNEIWGHGGADDLSGGASDDVILGGRGDDRMWGDRGNDVLVGNSADDTGYGSVDNDTLMGGTGNDWMSGGKDDDTLYGGRDNDALHGNTGDDAMSGGSGDDVVMGEAGNDALFGGVGADTVAGGSGDDHVLVSSGADALSGGAGYDTLDFSGMVGPLTLDLSNGSYAVGLTGANAGTVSGFEQVILGDGGSRVMGSDSGATVIQGGAGDDWMRSKMGADVLAGGAGSDTFAFFAKDSADGSSDLIADFEVGTDRLDLSNFMWNGRGADASVRFVDGAQGAVVQGFENGRWVDVVTLAGVDAGQLDYGILA